jgi:S-adenosylmethionine hydrolase
MIITLATDFGYNDPFVGVMKGVIAGINPRAQVVDLTHGIPPQDLLAAALILRHSVCYFPRGTVHVVVVDPGVGSARRPLLIESDGRYLIGPDNGVLSLALQGKPPNSVIHLSNPVYHLQPASATFHGRDVFSPVAAYLSLGIPPPAFGEPIDNFISLALPPVVKTQRWIDGEILYIDGFGNLFTNIRDHDVAGLAPDVLTIRLGAISIHGLAANYSAAREGEFVALVNSWGLLEIAINKGSARQLTQANIGDKVQVALSS